MCFSERLELPEPWQLIELRANRGDSLDETAAVTGGQVYGSDQIGEALARIDADNRSLFVVGYYPAAGNFLQ